MDNDGGEDHSGRRVVACHDSSIVQVDHARVQIVMWYTEPKVAAGHHYEGVVPSASISSIQLLLNSGERNEQVPCPDAPQTRCF